MKDTIGRENRKLADKLCEVCNRLFRPSRSGSRYCSRPCAWSRNGGQNRKPETWWINEKGYVEGRIWIDSDTQLQVKKHRWIMEQHLGRILRLGEDVHHIDGNKTNNDISNLRLMSHGEHSKHHNESRTYKHGYKLNLSPQQRAERSERMRRMRAAQKRKL